VRRVEKPSNLLALSLRELQVIGDHAAQEATHRAVTGTATPAPMGRPGERRERKQSE
jgi:hypothetical protein